MLAATIIVMTDRPMPEHLVFQAEHRKYVQEAYRAGDSCWQWVCLECGEPNFEAFGAPHNVSCRACEEQWCPCWPHLNPTLNRAQFEAALLET